MQTHTIWYAWEQGAQSLRIDVQYFKIETARLIWQELSLAGYHMISACP